NDLALICRFGGSYAAQDAQALATFQTALPDRTIVPVDCSGIIGSAGAIHCIVMHVPDLLFRDEFEGVE
ncbi:MAG TPA: agmatine deiminase family protein, partial [Dokdonella sp.]|nr:agmatine deiminase family protein [Dokdonella sp.]